MGILKRKNRRMKINQFFLAIGLVSTKPLIEDFKDKILSRQRRFFDLGVIACDFNGNAIPWEANTIARADQKVYMAFTHLMIAGLAETKRGNEMAERANTLSDQANHLAKIANTIGEKGLYYQSEASEISNYANQLAKMDLKIAKKANELNEAQIEQDYAIAMLTLDIEGRVAQMIEKLSNAFNYGNTSHYFDNIVKRKALKSFERVIEKRHEILAEVD